MSVYVENTFNYGADSSIQTQWHTLQQGIIAGYTSYFTGIYTHTPEVPNPPGFPPTSGTYTSRSIWSDLTQAEAYVAELQAGLAANPGLSAFAVGPLTAGEDTPA